MARSDVKVGGWLGILVAVASVAVQAAPQTLDAAPHEQTAAPQARAAAFRGRTGLHPPARAAAPQNQTAEQRVRAAGLQVCDRTALSPARAAAPQNQTAEPRVRAAGLQVHDRPALPSAQAAPLRVQALATPPPEQGTASDALPATPAPLAHVRGDDAGAAALIKSALAASPTVAALVMALNQSDVVVMVQVTLMPDSVAADTRLLTATPLCRYLVVRVHAARPIPEKVELLGHELQHAVEVAAAPDVSDEAGLARLMARIGRATGRKGAYETEAAIRVSRAIREELAGSPGQARSRHPRSR